MRVSPIVCPEESHLCFLQEGMAMGFLANPARRGLGASGKPLHCFIKRQLCRKEFPPARIGTCRPMGRSIVSGGDPRGVQGGERKAPLLA